jgi:hypothetical protein
MLIKPGPAHLYEQVKASWRVGKTDSSGRSDVPVDVPAVSGWLAGQMNDAMALFGEALLAEYGKPIQITGVRSMFSTQPASPEATNVRQPHLDHGRKALIGLWYFAHPEDKAGGDLMVGDIRVPYAENVMVIFPNLRSAWHHVTPRGPSQYARRFLNFVAEVEDPLHGYTRDALGRDRVYGVAICP